MAAQPRQWLTKLCKNPISASWPFGCWARSVCHAAYISPASRLQVPTLPFCRPESLSRGLRSARSSAAASIALTRTRSHPRRRSPGGSHRLPPAPQSPDHALAGGHLGAVVVCDVGLQLLALAQLTPPTTLGRSCSGKIERAVALRRNQRLAYDCIAERVGLSRNAVARACKSAGLAKLPSLQDAVPVRRYERHTPGELRTCTPRNWDAFDKPGHRVTGDRPRTPRGRAGKPCQLFP